MIEPEVRDFLAEDLRKRSSQSREFIARLLEALSVADWTGEELAEMAKIVRGETT